MLPRIVIVVSFFSLFFVPARANASAWFNNLSPYITAHSAELSPSLAPPYKNTPCQRDLKLITRQKDILKAHTEQSTITCAVRTAFGMQSASTNLAILNEANTAAHITGSAGNNLITYPIPNSNHLIHSISGGLNGSFLGVHQDFKDNLIIHTLASGSKQFKINTANSRPITDPLGVKYEFRDPRFSDNGQWMVSASPYSGIARVNIETGETLIFGPSHSYSIGLNPSYATAITSNGRYAVIAESRYELFKLYDLSTCIPNPLPRKPATCQSKDLWPIAKSSIQGFTGVFSIGFSTDTTLRFTAYHNAKHGLFTLTAGGETESTVEYLATGDSFASGEGAFNYKPGTDIETPFNKCHLSQVSYPYLLSSLFNKTESVACSGAKIKDITTSSNQSAGKLAASYDSEIYQNFLVGYRSQSSFVQKNKPLFITTSISGNDIGFGKIIAACVAPGTCYQSDQEKLNLAYTIESKVNDLTLLYKQISQEAATNARVYVIGYPEMVDPNGSCALNVRLNKDELILANQIVGSLNNAISKAATTAGVNYIDTTKVFAGHRLCETDSHKVALNGLTAGDDKTFSLPLLNTGYQADFYLVGRESYHPNQLGHRLLADLMKSHLSLPPIAPPLATNTVPVAQNSNLTPSKIIQDNITAPPIWESGALINIYSSGFRPNSTVKLALGTTPLTTVTANQNGEINMPVFAPAAPVGTSTLSASGVNSMDENIISQKLIYIASSESDIDGDGTPNTSEQCLFVDASGTDDDKDNIDDACDNFIGLPPIKVKPALVASTKSVTPASSNNNAVQLAVAAQNTPVNISNSTTNDMSQASVLGTSQTTSNKATNILARINGRTIEVTKPKPPYLLLLTPISIILAVLWWRRGK